MIFPVIAELNNSPISIFSKVSSVYFCASSKKLEMFKLSCWDSNISSCEVSVSEARQIVGKIKTNIQIKKINFDYLFLSYEIKCIKPSNDIYLQVIDALDCEADNIIFFDDNQKNVNGAKQLGINAYQVTGENIKEIFYKIINI